MSKCFCCGHAGEDNPASLLVTESIMVTARRLAGNRNSDQRPGTRGQTIVKSRFGRRLYRIYLYIPRYETSSRDGPAAERTPWVNGQRALGFTIDGVNAKELFWETAKISIRMTSSLET